MLMLNDLPIHTAIIGGILVFFVLLFIIRFLIPATEDVGGCILKTPSIFGSPRRIIARFARFPHRNQVLGRESTADEVEFLRVPGSGF